MMPVALAGWLSRIGNDLGQRAAAGGLVVAFVVACSSTSTTKTTGAGAAGMAGSGNAGGAGNAGGTAGTAGGAGAGGSGACSCPDGQLTEWQGPYFFWFGAPTGTPPSCAGESVELYDDSTSWGGAECQACTCAAGAQKCCATVEYYESASCPSPSPYSKKVCSDASCVNATVATSSGGAPNFNPLSVRVSVASETACTPQESGKKDEQPPPVAGKIAFGCAASCTSGQACPELPAGYSSLCLVSATETTCPAGTSPLGTTYHQKVDTRACKQCTCTPQCTMKVEMIDGYSCATAGKVASSGCTSTPTGTLGYKSSVKPVEVMHQGCTPSFGATGEATLGAPSAICCY